MPTSPGNSEPEESFAKWGVASSVREFHSPPPPPATWKVGCTFLLGRGRDSSVGIGTRYRLDGPGIKSRLGGEIFRTRPDRPWGPPSLLYKEYLVFPGGKAAGAWRCPSPPPPSSAEVEGRVQLYFCTPSGPSWPVPGWTLLLFCVPVKWRFALSLVVLWKWYLCLPLMLRDAFHAYILFWRLDLFVD